MSDGNGLPATIDCEQIERFDLDRSGRAILHVLEGSARRWFRHGERGWRELQPHEERELPGRPPLDLLGCELLAWRPGRRMTLRVPWDRGCAILKLYRRAAFRAAHRALAAVASVRSREALRTPVLLRADAAQASLLFEHLPGAPPTWTVADADLAYRTGAGLRALQEHVSGDGLPVHAPEAELAVLDQMQRRLTGLGLELPPRWRAVRAELGRTRSRATLRQAVLCHRDLHEAQLLDLGDQRVALIDLDFVCLADALLDAANLLAHLHLRVLQQRPGASQEAFLACGAALLEGLDREGEAGYRERLRYYEASALLRLSIVHSMRPRSAPFAPQLVALAERCLEDLRHPG